MCKIEKHINNFTKDILKIKIVFVQEDWKVTMIIKIKYEINKRYILKKIDKK